MLTRSHGLGNDYLVADPADLPFEITPERVVLLCDRHRGAGSDGLLLLDHYEDDGEWFVRIFNPDGSEAEKSGNGLRIFARWLFDTGRTGGQRYFWLNTIGGHAATEVHDNGEVSVDMGMPRFGEPTFLDIVGPVVIVDMGNPHCVVPRPALDRTELLSLGPLIEHHPAFPNRTNVQLAHAIDRQHVELLIWERGAGETQASGSSSCAVFAALHHLGQLDRTVTASMPGGVLRLWLDAENHIWLRGPVEEIAALTLSADLIARLQALP
jgi:diaminopimelate epimerase